MVSSITGSYVIPGCRWARRRFRCLSRDLPKARECRTDLAALRERSEACSREGAAVTGRPEALSQGCEPPVKAIGGIAKWVWCVMTLLRLQRTGLISCWNAAMQTLSWRSWYWSVNSKRGTKCAWNTRTWWCGHFHHGIQLNLSLFILENLLLEQSHTHSSLHGTSFFLKWSPGFPIWRKVLQLKGQPHVTVRDAYARQDGKGFFFLPNADTVIQRFCRNKRDQWVKKQNSGK